MVTQSSEHFLWDKTSSLDPLDKDFAYKSWSLEMFLDLIFMLLLWGPDC